MLAVVSGDGVQVVDPAAVGVGLAVALVHGVGVRTGPVPLGVVHTGDGIFLGHVLGGGQVILGDQAVLIQVVQGDQHLTPVVGGGAVGHKLAGEVIQIIAGLDVVGVVPAVPHMAPALHHEGDGVGILFLDLLQQGNKVFHGGGQVVNAVDQTHFLHGSRTQVPAHSGVSGVLGGQAVQLAVAGAEHTLDIGPAAVHAFVKDLDPVGKLVFQIIHGQNVTGLAQLLGQRVVGVPQDVGIVVAGHLQCDVGGIVGILQVLPVHDDVELFQQDLIQNVVFDAVSTFLVVSDGQSNLLRVGICRGAVRGSGRGGGGRFRGGFSGISAAGGHAQHHCQAKKQCDPFFH